jgi:hypothetical protein
MHDRRHDQKGRSTGQYMRQANKHAKIGSQFAPRTIDMLRSPAMGALSLTGRRILDRLEIEMADHGGTDNGSLPCMYEDFERFGIDRHQIAPGIAEVIALGFVRVMRPGRAGNAEYRLPTLYRLTYRHTAETGPTDEWNQIATDGKARDLVTAARRLWTERERQKRARKQKASGGARPISVGVPHTENEVLPVGITHTTGPVGVTHTTLDISGRGEQ